MFGHEEGITIPPSGALPLVDLGSSHRCIDAKGSIETTPLEVTPSRLMRYAPKALPVIMTTAAILATSRAS